MESSPPGLQAQDNGWRPPGTPLLRLSQHIEAPCRFQWLTKWPMWSARLPRRRHITSFVSPMPYDPRQCIGSSSRRAPQPWKAYSMDKNGLSSTSSASSSGCSLTRKGQLDCVRHCFSLKDADLLVHSPMPARQKRTRVHGGEARGGQSATVPPGPEQIRVTPEHASG